MDTIISRFQFLLLIIIIHDHGCLSVTETKLVSGYEAEHTIQSLFALIYVYWKATISFLFFNENNILLYLKHYKYKYCISKYKNITWKIQQQKKD